MIRKKKIIIALSVVVVLAGGTAGGYWCLQGPGDSQNEWDFAKKADFTKNADFTGERSAKSASYSATTKAQTVAQIFSASNMFLEVENVEVNVSDTVNQGDKLIKLSDSSVERAVSQLERKVSNAKTEYKQTKADYKSDVLEAKTTLQNSVTAGNVAKDTYDITVSELSDRLESAKKKYEETKSTNDKLSYKAAKTEYKTGVINAKKVYEEDLLESKSAQTVYDSEIEDLKAELAEKKAAYKEAKQTLEDFESIVVDGYICAAQSGTIAAVNCKDNMIIRDDVSIVSYYDENVITAELDISQSEIGNFSVGDTAEVAGDTTCRGTITSISTEAQTSGISNVYYTVTVSIDNSENEMTMGKNVSITFDSKTEEDA